MEKEKFYITTAIAYTSGKPHIGNTYEIVFTDAIARFMRMIGKDVFFLTGTDEHGIKIQERAESEGIAPKEYVDKVSAQVKGIWDLMNTSYDKFIRTTDAEHEKTVTDIFTKLYKQGDIYKSEYSGWYCTPCETFYTETQLNDGKCPDCGAEVKKTKEEAYFFKISKYQKKLEEYIEQNPDFITPESRKKEMINNFIKPGLQDLCVSRTTFNWGIPVEFDNKHVIYVWIDALSNYITALGYNVNGESGELYKKYWPCDVHIIGKDILRFHTIYWPIILMALGQPLPKQVFGHPWFLAGEDQKMSKSKGNTIYADDIVNYFGVDAVRFYLLSEMPYAQDGVITYSNVMSRYNSELANTLGNLVSRTLAMCNKYFDGVIPAPGEDEDFDIELKKSALEAVNGVKNKMTEYRVSEAIDELFNLLRRSNKYIDETMPWSLAKTDQGKQRLKSVIYNLLEAIRISAVLLQPFMTITSDKILGMLNTSAKDWQSVQNFGGLEAGVKLGEAQMLFARIDEEKMAERISADISAKVPQKQVPQDVKQQISIDEFSKIELRTAQVIECEPVPKSDKLLKLQLDLGYETRQVVSGIAKFYKPKDLIGKKVVMCANLAPVKLRGVESFGMILASGQDDVRVLFVDDDTPNGSSIH